MNVGLYSRGELLAERDALAVQNCPGGPLYGSRVEMYIVRQGTSRSLGTARFSNDRASFRGLSGEQLQRLRCRRVELCL
jgi:hypothetical protein